MNSSYMPIDMLWSGQDPVIFLGLSMSKWAFQLKDWILDEDKLNVVDKISCHDCDVSQVYEAGRALKTH